MSEARKVLSIFGDPLPLPGEIRQDVIAELEKALERAKAGQTIGIALVEVLNPTMDSTQWVVSGYTTRSMVGSLMEIVTEQCRK